MANKSSQITSERGKNSKKVCLVETVFSLKLFLLWSAIALREELSQWNPLSSFLDKNSDYDKTQ